jgi:hypothetical protein
MMPYPGEQKAVTEPVLKPATPIVNKGGRPKKEVTTSAKTKEDLFRAFQQAGGLPRLVKLLQERPVGKTKESRKKKEQSDKLFLELAFNVLPKMVPKETSIDVETKSVIFQFTDRDPEEIKKKLEDKAIDIEFTKEA